MDYQLRALEKRERFMAIKRPHRRALQRRTGASSSAQHLDEAEYALVRLRRRARAARASSRPTSSTATTTSWRSSSARPTSTRARPRRRSATSRACSRSSPTTSRRSSSRGVILHERGDCQRAERLLEARGGDLSRRLPAALQPRRGLRRRRATWRAPSPTSSRRLRARPRCRRRSTCSATAATRWARPRDGDPQPPRGGAARSGVRGGALPARARLPRPPLEQEGARRRSARRSGSTRAGCATRIWCSFLSGRTGAPLPEVGAEAARYMAKAEEHRRARRARPGARRLPEGARRSSPRTRRC